MDLDPFRRPRSESSGGGGMEKFMMGPDPVTTCSLAPITTLPIVSSPAPLEMYPNPNKGLLGGVNILRAALTGSNDVMSGLSFNSLAWTESPFFADTSAIQESRPAGQGQV